jgi:Tn3 transposase DDE domain
MGPALVKKGTLGSTGALDGAPTVGNEFLAKPVAERRRNILAALIAIGCNLGPQRMAVASGLSVREISEVADWYLTEDALKAASIDLVNYASNLPLSPIYGRGASCSAGWHALLCATEPACRRLQPRAPGSGCNSLCTHR